MGFWSGILSMTKSACNKIKNVATVVCHKIKSVASSCSSCLAKSFLFGPRLLFALSGFIFRDAYGEGPDGREERMKSFAFDLFMLCTSFLLFLLFWVLSFVMFMIYSEFISSMYFNHEQINYQKTFMFDSSMQGSTLIAMKLIIPCYLILKPFCFLILFLNYH